MVSRSICKVIFRNNNEIDIDYFVLKNTHIDDEMMREDMFLLIMQNKDNKMHVEYKNIMMIINLIDNFGIFRNNYWQR